MAQDAVNPAPAPHRPRRRSDPVLPIASAAALAALGAVSAGAAGQADTPQTGLSVEREVCTWQSDGKRLGCGPESEVDMKPPARGMLIYELNRFPSSEPTVEQQRAADELLVKTVASAKSHGWLDFQQAIADGFEPMPGDRSHYMNADFINDEQVLDPQRPEFLMYSGEELGKKLVALMFIVNSPEDEGPQIGGPLTRWHFHTWSRVRCFSDGRATHVPALANGTCAIGTPSSRGPQMMHVWLLDHPGGRFATRMGMRRDVMRRLLADRGY